MIVPPPTGSIPAATDRQRAGERERLPDQLRGLALLGIVLVNMPFLAISTSGFTAESTSRPIDEATRFLVVAFAQGKFYLLFSFLFGYSLTLLLRSTAADGLRRYRRRLLALAALGLGHAVFFFVGDILFSYAILGVGLMWFVRRSDRAALIGAGVAYLVGVLVLTLLVVAEATAPTTQAAGLSADIAATDDALRGGFVQAAAARVNALPIALTVQAFLNWSLAFAMFLLGLLAGRRRLLAHPEGHRRLWRALLIVAAVVGLPCALVSATLFSGAGDDNLRLITGVAVGFAGAPFLSAGYVALAALCTQSRVLSAMAPAGRMSLSGYLGESILMSAIFCGWGGGLLGDLSAAECAVIAVAVWVVLDVTAKLWLVRFRYGPFEWVLRAWSYGHRPPLRRERTRHADRS